MTTHYTHLFLRPTLTQISFRISSAASVLSTLTSRCPKLTDILVSWHSYRLLPSLSRFVEGLECAESIWVPYLDQRALERLPGLPALNFLALNTFPASLALSLARDRLTFTCLRHLRLLDSEVRPTLQFLDICSNLLLGTFLTRFPDLITAAETQSLFTVITASLSHLTLTNLTLEYHCDSDARDPAIYLVTSAPHNGLHNDSPRF